MFYFHPPPTPFKADNMRSSELKDGVERAWHRALLHALGVTREVLGEIFQRGGVG